MLKRSRIIKKKSAFKVDDVLRIPLNLSNVDFHTIHSYYVLGLPGFAFYQTGV
jgi:hypothetical protein